MGRVRRITLKTIARDLGLSPTAVSLALRERPSTTKVSNATRERVLAYARELDYRPDRSARAMRGAGSLSIGILHSGGLQQLRSQKLVHLVQSVEKAGFDAVVMDVFVETEEALRRAGDMLRDFRVDGVVIQCNGGPQWTKEIDRFHAAGIPLVAKGEKLKGIPQYISNKEQGFHDLTGHLLGLGYRRMVLMTKGRPGRKKSWHERSAVEGYHRAFREEGLPEDEAEVFLIDSSKASRLPEYRNMENGYGTGLQAMAELLKRPRLPEVVLCSNDTWAMGALTACAEAGLKVPADIALTGCENELFSAYGSVPLTTIEHPVKELAERAVERLIGLVKGEGPPVRSNEVHLAPCRLIVRESCGANLPVRV